MTLLWTNQTKLSNHDQKDINASIRKMTWVFQDLLSQDLKIYDRSLDSKRNDEWTQEPMK